MSIFTKIIESETKHHEDRFQIFMSNIPTTIFGNIFNASVFFYFSYFFINGQIFIWYVSILAVAAIRLLHIFIYRKVGYSRPLEISANLLILFSGSVWGVLPVILYKTEIFELHVFMTFVIGGMAAGAASTLSHNLKVYISYISILLFPLILTLILYRDELHNAMAAVIIMYYIVIFSSGFNMHRRLMENITLKKKSADDEQKIFDSETSLQNLFDATPMGIFLFDLTKDDRLLFSGFNLAAESVLKNNCQIYMGKELEFIFPALSDTDIPMLFRRIASESMQWNQREIHYHSDNINGIYEISVFQVKKNRIAVIFSDITERKKMEDQLIQAKDAAVAANHAKSNFLSSMSHELRTPLNAIIGFAQLLTMKKLPIEESDIKSILEIKNAGNHLLSLIDELLDMAKIESGKMVINPVQIIVADVLGECISLIESAAAKRNISIDYVSSSCDGLSLYADYKRTKQLILNILSNAVKYNKENGKIIIQCSSRQDQIKITISDTGIGIPGAKLKHLFTPYHRLGASENIEGSGIGLMISRDLAVLMNGDISVQSEEGAGSTFSIMLPAYKV